MKSFIYQNVSEANNKAIAREMRSRECLFYSGKSDGMNKCAHGNDLIEREKLIMLEQREKLLEL